MPSGYHWLSGLSAYPWPGGSLSEDVRFCVPDALFTAESRFLIALAPVWTVSDVEITEMVSSSHIPLIK